MPSIKNLAFAPVFLIIFAALGYRISFVLTDYAFLFSLNLDALIEILITCSLFLLSALSFVLFTTFANDWKLIGPVILVALSLPFIFIPYPFSLVLATGFLITFLITYLGLENKLKTYLTFQPTVILTPNIKNVSTLLIFVTAIGFYLSMNVNIKNNGFSVPDALIDSVLKAVPMPTESTTQSQEANPTSTTLPHLNSEQIALLKQNPQALKQFGLDPSILDTLDSTNPTETINNTVQQSVKQTVKSQLDQVIKPYLSAIPIFLALILFLTLNWIASILAILLSPIVWSIFRVLEKSGYVTYTKEMREVKKLVV